MSDGERYILERQLCAYEAFLAEAEHILATDDTEYFRERCGQVRRRVLRLGTELRELKAAEAA